MFRYRISILSEDEGTLREGLRMADEVSRTFFDEPNEKTWSVTISVIKNDGAIVKED